MSDDYGYDEEFMKVMDKLAELYPVPEIPEDSLCQQPVFPKRQFNVFFLINAGGSMAGQKIGAINAAMPKAIEYLKRIQEKIPVTIIVSTMKISDYPEWVEQTPVPLEEYHWKDITAGGKANLDSALCELNSKLSRNAYLQSPAGCYTPTIVLLSSNNSFDRSADGIKALEHNPWFKYCNKAAFILDTEPDIKDKSLLFFWDKSANNRYLVEDPNQLEERLLSFIDTSHVYISIG